MARMRTLHPVVLRLALPPAVMLGYYGAVRLSIAADAGTQHRGDTGLGLAVLLGFICLGFIAGYSWDLIRQACKRRYALAWVDLLVLSVLLMPFGWVGCNWFGLSRTPVCWLPIHMFGAVIDLLGL